MHKILSKYATVLFDLFMMLAKLAYGEKHKNKIQIKTGSF